MDYVKKCDKCQRFVKAHKAPSEHLHSVISPWPFYKLGVDILGPFPIAPDQLKFLIPVATISSERIKRFFWKKIIYRFGIPAEIVSDNGTQFASHATAEFCEGLKIKQLFTSIEHPQANGQAEAANKVILRGLRKRLEEAKGRWAEELSQVLWSYHTTPHSTTNEIPFRLTFGTEAMIPVEIGEPSPRTALFEPSENEEELRENLDMLQEVREIAHLREYAVKASAARKEDKRIVPYLVLRKITHKVESNKLTPIWEGPFRVLEEVGRGAYCLENLDGRKVPCTWNAATLRIMMIQKQRCRLLRSTRPKNGRSKKTDPRSNYNRLRSTRPKNGRSKKTGPGSDYNRPRSTRPKNGRSKKTDPGSDYNRLRSTRPKNGLLKKTDLGFDYNRLRSTRPKNRRSKKTDPRFDYN
ncbi:Tf2-11, partial [Mucuna pruriens]